MQTESENRYINILFYVDVLYWVRRFNKLLIEPLECPAEISNKHMRSRNFKILLFTYPTASATGRVDSVPWNT